MQYVQLGRSGVKVSRLCLGTMNFGPETTEADSFAIMDRALELVLQRDPELMKARLVLGRLYIKTGRTAEGQRLLADFRRAQALEDRRARVGVRLVYSPRSADAHWQMALVYREMGDLPHMRVEARKTLELAPGHKGARELMQGAR